MKIRDGARFCADPKEGCAAILLYGDEALAAERREAFIAALALRAGGPLEPLERIAAATLRRDSAALDTAMRSTGFFAETRAVLVECASDAAAPTIAEALDLADARTALIVEAGALRAGSKLRKLFEAHGAAAAIACWPEPPGRGDVADRLAALGAEAGPDAFDALDEMASAMERGAFWREIDKLALYAAGSAEPLSAEDVAACGPAALGSEVDAALEALSARDAPALRAALARLDAQGVAPETTLALALRRFRMLLDAAAIMEAQRCDAEAALGRLTPPIRFPRSKPLARQLARWRRPMLEQAFSALRRAQIAQRGALGGAGSAATERVLLRLALGAR